MSRAVAFYTQRLGFTLKHKHLPAFANVSLGSADVLLSGPRPVEDHNLIRPCRRPVG